MYNFRKLISTIIRFNRGRDWKFIKQNGRNYKHIKQKQNKM